MIPRFRTFIILFAVIFCLVQSQQKEYTVTKAQPLPDSWRTLTDTLIVNKIDEKKIHRGWSKLNKGISVSQVLNLLGKPMGIEYSSLDESITWHYRKRTVVFDNIKQTLRYWEK